MIKKIKTNSGSALVSAFIAIAVITIVLAGALGLSQANYQRALNAENRSQAYYAAQSALGIFSGVLTADASALTGGQANLKNYIEKAGFIFKTDNISFDKIMCDSCSVAGSYEKTPGEQYAGVITLTAEAVKIGQKYTVSLIVYDYGGTYKIGGYRKGG